MGAQVPPLDAVPVVALGVLMLTAYVHPRWRVSLLLTPVTLLAAVTALVVTA